jgi:phosphoglycolate phosphatase
MHEPIRAVLFDFERTLVDFQWRLAAAQAELRRAFVEQGYAVQGNYAEMRNAAVDPAAPQGRLEALRLADRRVESAMVSNVGRAALVAARVRFGVERWPWPVHGRDGVTRLKPNPEGVSQVLAALKVPAEGAFFVGGSLADVHAARAVGMRVAIIRGGEADEAAFAAAPPDWTVSRPDRMPRRPIGGCLVVPSSPASD